MKKILAPTLILLLILTACGQSAEPIDTDPPTTETTTSDTSSTAETEPESSNEISDDELIELTLEELAAYNGKDGQPAYVAVDGIIYDMTNSKAWGGGQHNGFEAGKDLTEALNNVSPHGPSKLENVPAIGILVTAEESESTSDEPVATEEVAEESEPPAEPEETADAPEPPAETEEIADVPEPAEESEEMTEVSEPTEENETTPETESESETIENESESSELMLTIDELAAYNGKDGMPAYIAVDGIIYDVSHLSPWEGGEHNGNLAGLDLTDDLAYAPHGPEKLEKAIIVGKLVK